MKILVVGSQGMLGTELVQMLRGEHEVLEGHRHNCNILDERQVATFIGSHHPDVIIHAAAYTNVDQAESDKEAALNVNETGTGHVATVAKYQGARFVYISTDYVFDGTGTRPYTEQDMPHPLGVYGESKLRGEQQVRQIFGEQGYLIVRTSWLYGRHGKNFVNTILQHAQCQPVLRVVNDQTGSPTHTKDLIRGLIALLHRQEVSGIIHVANAGYCTWYEFAKTILELRHMSHVAVEPISTAELHRPAPRPNFSVLDTSKFVAVTGRNLQHWKQGLQEYLDSTQSVVSSH